MWMWRTEQSSAVSIYLWSTSPYPCGKSGRVHTRSRSICPASPRTPADTESHITTSSHWPTNISIGVTLTPGSDPECPARSPTNPRRTRSTGWRSVGRSACSPSRRLTWTHTRDAMSRDTHTWRHWRKTCLCDLQSALQEVANVLVSFGNQMKRFSDDLLLCVFSLKGIKQSL